MTTEVRTPAEMLDSHWTYEHVLLLALAYLPKDVTRLTADAGRWSQVVSDVKARFRDRSPKLLAAVHFTRRPPLPPYSEQLDDFFRDTGVSGVLAAGHPAYRVFPFPERVKEQLRNKLEPRLAAHLEDIREMSGYLQGLVAPADPEA